MEEKNKKDSVKKYGENARKVLEIIDKVKNERGTKGEK